MAAARAQRWLLVLCFANGGSSVEILACPLYRSCSGGRLGAGGVRYDRSY